MPNTTQEWLDVAHERAIDATKLKEQQRRLAAMYMVGYFVECRLKACLKHSRKTWSAGREGHNLRGLLEKCGLKLHDLGGHRRRFAELWSTDLRYENSLINEPEFDGLFEGALQLAGYIEKRISRGRGRP
jgi:hypothetical protein